MHKPQTLTWGRGWVGPYEGPFTLALKSAWANLSTAAGTSALFSGQSFGNGWQVQGSASLLSRPPDSSDVWVDRCLSHYAGDWTFELASDQHFRFCPECLRHGYQASVYQVQALRLCPIHFCELKVACTQCGASTCSYSLNPVAFSKPFHCWSCGDTWVDGLGLRSLSDTEALHGACEVQLAQLYQWLSSLQKFAIVDRRKGARSGHCRDGWYRTIDPDCQLLERMGVDRRIVGFWTATHLSSMPIDDDIFFKISQRLAFASVKVAWNSERGIQGNYAPLESFIPIYKSIRRHIERRYLKRCGHEMAIEAPGSTHRQMTRNARNLLGICVSIWRRRFELTLDFDLYKRVQRSWAGYLRTNNSLPDSARRCRFFYASAFLKWYRSDRDLLWPIELLPALVLSNFFFLCNELVALLDEMDEDQSEKEKHGALDTFSETECIWQYANLRQRILDTTEFPEQISGPYLGTGDALFRTPCSQVVRTLVHSAFAATNLARN